MSFTITILGSNSAAPTSARNSSSQLLDTGRQRFLLDCAEGTQIQLRRLKTGIMKIDHVMITHLHGDHFFGLIGLMTTWHLLGRNKPLHIYSVAELKPLLDAILKATQTTLIYPVVYHFFNPEIPEVIYEDLHLEVTTIPLLHRIPTCGFLFREKPGKRRIKKESIAGRNFPYSVYDQLRNGLDVALPDGTELKNEDYTIASSPPFSYAYCTDTGYLPDLVKIVEGVDLLFHEATFCESEKALATEKQHSTARQAAQIALQAKAGTLLLGHYSARYKDLSPLLAEAKEVFEQVILAEDGMIIKLEES